MTPLPQEQVQQTAQVLLAFLDSDGANVPGSLIEGVVSGKSLLRGLLTGHLVVAQVDAPPEDKKPAPKKAAAKKKAPVKKS